MRRYTGKKFPSIPGQSLLWVMIMGLIIIYLYGLIGFAFLRPLFDPEDELYCHTLAQCVVTVLRYGVVGGISEVCLVGLNIT